MTEKQADLMLNSLSNISQSLERIAIIVEAAANIPVGGAVDVKPEHPDDLPPAGKTRVRRTKAEIEADKAKETTAPAVKTDIFATEETATASSYTELDVRKAAKDALDVVGYDKVEEILKKYSKTGQVKNVLAKDYPAIITELQKLTKKA